MDIARKLEMVHTGIRSIAEHDDADHAEVQAAMESVREYAAQQLALAFERRRAQAEAARAVTKSAGA
jgi:hypothetical protein